MPGLLLDLLEQDLLGTTSRQAGDLLEGTLELVAPLRHLGAVILELGFSARQRLLATVDRRGAFKQVGVQAGRIRANHLDYRRGGGGAARGRRPGAMHPAVDDGVENDSHRYQRCGTDDFHGRSSPSGSGEEPGPDSKLWFLERPSGPREAAGTDAGKAAGACPQSAATCRVLSLV